MDTTFLQQSAGALINMTGQPVTLTPPGGSYNSATSTWTGTGVPITTTGVLLPLSRGLKHMPGTDIQIGDQQLLLPGTIVQPLVDTKVVIGAKTYTIIEVAPVNPAGSALYYDCIVRSGQ